MPLSFYPCTVKFYCMVAGNRLEDNGQLDREATGNIKLAIHRYLDGTFIAIFTGSDETLQASAKVLHDWTKDSIGTIRVCARKIISCSDFNRQDTLRAFVDALDEVAQAAGNIGAIVNEDLRILLVADEAMIRKVHPNNQLDKLTPGDIVHFVYEISEQGTLTTKADYTHRKVV